MMPIVKVKIDNEIDIVLAHKRAKQLGGMTGLTFADQAKFAAAVSEISRNTIEHAYGGEVRFLVEEKNGNISLFACIADSGNGISDLEDLLLTLPRKKGKGLGIKSSKKLVDFFDIQTEAGQGTRIKLGMRLPLKHPPINQNILKGWKEHFESELPVSPYEELKKQNDELIQALEEVKFKNVIVENQLEEIRQLNYELQKQNAEVSKLSKEKEHRNLLLEEKNKQLDEFAYIVSHDLKAPLNNMYGLLQIFEEDDPNKERLEEMQMFADQVDKMKRMIDNILSYARSGNESVEKTKVSVSKLINTIITGLPQRPGIKIKVQPYLPDLFTEEIYLEQIFSNLISNALKHHDKEAGIIKVNGTVGNQGFIEFEVSDDGPGIPTVKKGRIFDLFNTIQKSRSMHNTGIGLAIVKKIVEMKGGTIRVEDNSPTGSKFIFTWPIGLADSTEINLNK